MPKGLNEKQKQFVREYLIDRNATQAAIRCGYSEKTASVQGCRLLTNAKIKAAVDKGQRKRAERTEIDQDYVIEAVVDTLERCQQARPVLDRKGDQVYVEGPEGDIVPAYTFEAGSVLRAAELLGKNLRMFTDRTEHSGPDGGPIQTENSFTAMVLNSVDGKTRSK